MINDRNYILNRIRSKTTSIEEFNYDSLIAPPLSMFFTPYDINQLHSIASSLKLSARPKERYDAIDKICNSRGLVKYAAGTNRVVYRHPEFPGFLFKIASDDVGMRDNPDEYRNQNLLKPFCAKCFEISPCGTVAICERVNPITSREEFISVLDDVFELLTEWIIGKYVIADCGSKYFMNFGVRPGFGVVVLDYPYLYELDGNKLFCNKVDATSISGKCDGVIDYDAGFNHLICTKCGAVYKAKELETKIKDNEIIVENEGEIKMKITVSGGSNNVNREINLGGGNENFSEMKNKIELAVKKTESSAERRVNKINLNEALGYSNNKEEINLVVKTEKAVTVEEPAKTVDEIVETVEMDFVPKSVNGVSTEVKKVETPVVEVKEEVVEEVAEDTTEVVVEEPVKRSPVTFSEEIKAEAIKEAVNKEKLAVTPVQAIEMAVATIVDNVPKIDIDSVKLDMLTRLFDSIVSLMGDNLNVYDLLVSTLNRLLKNLEDDDFEKASLSESICELFKSIYTPSIKLGEVTRKDDDLLIKYTLTTNVITSELDEDGDPVYKEVANVNGDTPLEIKGVFTGITESDNTYDGAYLCEAETLTISDIDSSSESYSVIVPKDTDNNYITKNGKIVAINTLDNKSVDSSTLVTKSWFEFAKTAIISVTADDEKEEEAEVEATPEISNFLNQETMEV